MPRSRRRPVSETSLPGHANAVLKTHDLDDMFRRLSPSEIVRRVSDTRGMSGSGRGAPAAALLSAARSVQQLRKSPGFVQQWEEAGLGDAIPAGSPALREHARNVQETGWASTFVFADAGQLAGIAAASEGQLRVSKGRGPKTSPNIYGVRQGRFRGVFVGLAWAEVEPFVRGHSAAVFKKWRTEQEARSWVSGGSDGPCRLVTPATLRAARVLAGLDSPTDAGAELIRCWDEPATAAAASGAAAALSTAAAPAAGADAAAARLPSKALRGGHVGASGACSREQARASLVAAGDRRAPPAVARAAGSSRTSSVAPPAHGAAAGGSGSGSGSGVAGASGGCALEPPAGGAEGEEVEPPGDYTLWFDGASRSNPGPAAWGSVLRAGTGDPSGRLCFSGHGFMGEATNNEAEYTGLIRGLEMSGRLLVGGSRLLVRGDSKLALSQVAGRWQARDPRMAALRGAALAAKRALEARGVAVKLEHVLRGRNAEADSLASSGVDAGLSGELRPGFESGMGLPRA